MRCRFFVVSDVMFFWGGGFKYVFSLHLPGEMIQFDEHIFQMGLKPPTSFVWLTFGFHSVWWQNPYQTEAFFQTWWRCCFSLIEFGLIRTYLLGYRDFDAPIPEMKPHETIWTPRASHCLEKTTTIRFMELVLFGWWCHICFIFTPIRGRFPFWLIFFRWVETTNQLFTYIYHKKSFYMYQQVSKGIVNLTAFFFGTICYP